MTNVEEQAVEQRTRLFDASDIVRDLANQADAPEAFEKELRDMANRLVQIGHEIARPVRVVKARAAKGASE